MVAVVVVVVGRSDRGFRPSIATFCCGSPQYFLFPPPPPSFCHMLRQQRIAPRNLEAGATLAQEPPAEPAISFMHTISGSGDCGRLGAVTVGSVLPRLATRDLPPMLKSGQLGLASLSFRASYRRRPRPGSVRGRKGMQVRPGPGQGGLQSRPIVSSGHGQRREPRLQGERAFA